MSPAAELAGLRNGDCPYFLVAGAAAAAIASFFSVEHPHGHAEIDQAPRFATPIAVLDVLALAGLAHRAAGERQRRASRARKRCSLNLRAMSQQISPR
jgi:hypothetical protein